MKPVLATAFSTWLALSGSSKGPSGAMPLSPLIRPPMKPGVPGLDRSRSTGRRQRGSAFSIRNAWPAYAPTPVFSSANDVCRNAFRFGRGLAEVELRLGDRVVAQRLREVLDMRLLVPEDGHQEVLLALAEVELPTAAVLRGLLVEVALQVLQREREVEDPDVTGVRTMPADARCDHRRTASCQPARCPGTSALRSAPPPITAPPAMPAFLKKSSARVPARVERLPSLVGRLADRPVANRPPSIVRCFELTPLLRFRAGNRAVSPPSTLRGPEFEDDERPPRGPPVARTFVPRASRR